MVGSMTLKIDSKHAVSYRGAAASTGTETRAIAGVVAVHWMFRDVAMVEK